MHQLQGGKSSCGVGPVGKRCYCCVKVTEAAQLGVRQTCHWNSSGQCPGVRLRTWAPCTPGSLFIYRGKNSTSTCLLNQEPK
jgi:hypothetical protein